MNSPPLMNRQPYGNAATATSPVIRYHGGKFRLAPWIIGFFPEHRIYIEPFGGAAGVMLQKPRCYAEVYNDLDDDIGNLFRVLQQSETRDRLIEQLTLTPYARREFELAYLPHSDPVESARRICVRAQMGFGSAGATKGTTGFRTDISRPSNTAQHLWAKYPATLSSIAERFRGVLIENRPATDVITTHDQSDALLYVDPPYVLSTRHHTAATHGYYRHEMSNADHAALLTVLRKAKGMVVLSGYPNALYDQILVGWQQHTKQSRIGSHRGTAIRTESVWLNPACIDALPYKNLFSQTLPCPN
jgi:DNA adenine methylase